jgi:hypothetical protein
LFSETIFTGVLVLQAGGEFLDAHLDRALARDAEHIGIAACASLMPMA